MIYSSPGGNLRIDGRDSMKSLLVFENHAYEKNCVLVLITRYATHASNPFFWNNSTSIYQKCKNMVSLDTPGYGLYDEGIFLSTLLIFPRCNNVIQYLPRILAEIWRTGC